MTDYTIRRKKSRVRSERTVYSRVPVGGKLWRLRQKKKRDIIPSLREQRYVKAIGVYLISELRRILREKNVKQIDLAITGSTNPHVLTFISGKHDYDIFCVVNREDILRVRSIIADAFPRGVFTGIAKDVTKKAVVPYTVKRIINLPTHEGTLRMTVNVDYCVISPDHDRYATVQHVRVLSRALSRHPELRQDIILMKHAIKERKIDVVHQGLTSAAISFGIIKAGGWRPWIEDLIGKLRRWENTINERDRPFLADPAKPSRNLLANMPCQRGVIKRIVSHLEDILEDRPIKEKISGWIKIDFVSYEPKLPQDIIAKTKRASQRVWNEEYFRIHGRTTDARPFVTMFGNKVVVYLPPIPGMPEQKVYLPLCRIRNKEEAIERFKLAHKNWGKDTEGYFYVRPSMSPDYNRIKRKILSILYTK